MIVIEDLNFVGGAAIAINELGLISVEGPRFLMGWIEVCDRSSWEITRSSSLSIFIIEMHSTLV